MRVFSNEMDLDQVPSQWRNKTCAVEYSESRGLGQDPSYCEILQIIQMNWLTLIYGGLLGLSTENKSKINKVQPWWSESVL